MGVDANTRERWAREDATSQVSITLPREPVPVEPSVLYSAVEQMTFGLPAAYDRAMDQGVRNGTHWERFAADVRALHALTEALV